MRGLRFLLAGVAVVVAGLVPALVAGAAETRWAGSRWDAPLADGYRTSDNDLTISGVFVYDSTVGTDPPSYSVDEVVIDIVPSTKYVLPDGCGVPDGSTTKYPPGEPGVKYEAPFYKTVKFPCNGSYVLYALACTAPGCDDPKAPQDWHQLKATVHIAAPPGAPKGLEVVQGKGRAVKVSWNEYTNPELDFAGYSVERAIGDGRFAYLTRTAETSYTDQAPTSGGTLRYRVRALRSAPGGFAATDPGAAPVASVKVPAVTTTTASGGSGGTSGGPSITAYRPRTGSSFRPPSIGTPTTLDTGFDELLPYDDDREPGTRDAVLPADENESASILYEEAGAGVLVPVASALVLVMWAVHIRYINRLAKRT